jgi:type II secretory ATPase GspE/PulE/Tfp pilus assembly ATPase PilB-like protein
MNTNLLENPVFLQLCDYFDNLTEIQANKILLVNVTRTNESLLRKIIIFTIIKGYSDIHVEIENTGAGHEINIFVRDTDDFHSVQNLKDTHKEIKERLFSLCNFMGGAVEGVNWSASFKVQLPSEFAIRFGLTPFPGLPYGVNFRVEYIQTFSGLAFTCRLIDPQTTPKFADLKLPKLLSDTIMQICQAPSGLIVVSGPTGSGKSTLLNAIFQCLNDGSKSVVTIENPVEFKIFRHGAPVKQIQVQGEITFASALRATLRLDPQLILVGEIRDFETMDAAIEAANTGHLVFATVHANDAHNTLQRMHHLKADAFKISESLTLVLAQRLLTTYEGPGVQRALTYDEKSWLANNGIFMDHITENVGPKLGKVPVIEAIVMDSTLKNEIRGSEKIDTFSVYKAARHQHTYESMVSFGVRCVQDHGCKLSQVQGSLEQNHHAKKFPGFRVDAAQKYGVTLSEISLAIEDFYAQRTTHSSAVLNEFMNHRFEFNANHITPLVQKAESALLFNPAYSDPSIS